jgi:hypothetical protein
MNFVNLIYMIIRETDKSNTPRDWNIHSFINFSLLYVERDLLCCMYDKCNKIKKEIRELNIL